MRCIKDADALGTSKTSIAFLISNGALSMTSEPPTARARSRNFSSDETHEAASSLEEPITRSLPSPTPACQSDEEEKVVPPSFNTRLRNVSNSVGFMLARQLN